MNNVDLNSISAFLCFPQIFLIFHQPILAEQLYGKN